MTPGPGRAGMNAPGRPLSPSKPLDQTHDWMGWQHHERVEGNLFRLTALPVCRKCWVEGYEDEPGAFADCPGHACWPGHAHLTAPAASSPLVGQA